VQTCGPIRDDLLHGAKTRANHRRSAGKRLDDGQGKVLVALAGQNEHLGILDRRLGDGVAYLAQESHLRESEFQRHFFQLPAHRAVANNQQGDTGPELPPSSEQRLASLFRREPADKNCTVSASVLFPRVGRDKIRFDHDLFRGQAPPGELPPGELRQGNVKTYPVNPGSSLPVHGEHEGDGGRRPVRLVVTGVLDATPKAGFAAFLADFAIPEKRGRGAQQAEVVEGLHYRNACLPAGGKNRWRDLNKGIVDVDKVRPLLTKQGQNLPVCVPGPNQLFWQTQLLEGRISEQLFVTPLIDDNFVTMAFQELPLLGKDPILSSGKLVVVMDKNYLHCITVRT
jgi:hypothetical protein